MCHGQIVDRICRDKFESLMVKLHCLVEMPKNLGVGSPCGPSLNETIKGNGPQLPHASATPQPVALVEKIKALPEPAIGVIEVAEGGKIFEGTPKIKGRNRRTDPVADSLAEFKALFIGRNTVHKFQLAADLPQLVKGDRKNLDRMSLSVLQLPRGSSQSRHSAWAGPAHETIL